MTAAAAAPQRRRRLTLNPSCIANSSVTDWWGAAIRCRLHLGVPRMSFVLHPSVLSFFRGELALPFLRHRLIRHTLRATMFDALQDWPRLEAIALK